MPGMSGQKWRQGDSTFGGGDRCSNICNIHTRTEDGAV